MRTGYIPILLVLSLLTGWLHASTYYVNGGSRPAHPDGTATHPFNDLQYAVDHAEDGDTIIVAPGQYLSSDPWAYGELKFNGKSLRLVSSTRASFSAAEKTVLCGVIIFRGDEKAGTILQGFKIQNHGYGGILGNHSAASVSHCIISGNGPCGATVLKDVRGRISNCLIVDNTTFHGCAAGPVVSGCPELFNCTIANNSSAISIVEDNMTSNNKDIWVHNCIIYGNGGEQLAASWWPSHGATSWTFPPIDHCLIQDWSKNWESMGIQSRTNIDDDPCFVQPGHWEGMTLIEGDYHLKSEGYRWSNQPIHGSNWDVDFETSCAIDAGDPMDPLGEEPEHVLDDPTGLWGGNHAIDIGAYGGTSQASLAPAGERVLSGDGIYYRLPGRPLGARGVDLRDYLPLSEGPTWTRARADETFRTVHVGAPVLSNRYELYNVEDRSLQERRNVLFGFVDDVLYMFPNPPARFAEPGLKDLPKEAKYPRILTVGSTIEAPADLFAQGTSARRPALVLRGTLAEVLDGTKLTPNELTFARWVHNAEFDPNRIVDLADVIAIREKKADATAGEPIALFARGIGPLLLDGEPVATMTFGPVALTLMTSDSSTGTTSEH